MHRDWRRRFLMPFFRLNRTIPGASSHCLSKMFVPRSSAFVDWPLAESPLSIRTWGQS
jgi:hypothetical protein